MVAAGATATLTVEARSELPLQYQWMLNGVDVALGGNSPNYALTDSPRTPIAGLYSVKVSDERGSIVSKTVQVAVVNSPSVCGTGGPSYPSKNGYIDPGADAVSVQNLV